MNDFCNLQQLFTHFSHSPVIITMYLIRVLGKVTSFKEKTEYEEHCFNSAGAEAIR